jgi:hypothetical protein
VEFVVVVFGDDDAAPVIAVALGRSARLGTATKLEFVDFVGLETAFSVPPVCRSIFLLDTDMNFALVVVALLGLATCAQDAIASTG